MTEVLEGGKFYVQPVADQKVASIQKQLAALIFQDAPHIGAFNPKKGDLVLAQFSADNSWNRALVSSRLWLTRCFFLFFFVLNFSQLCSTSVELYFYLLVFLMFSN